METYFRPGRLTHEPVAPWRVGEGALSWKEAAPQVPCWATPIGGPFLRWVELLLHHHRQCRSLASGMSSGFCPHYSSLLGTSVACPKCATDIAAVEKTTNLQIHTEQTRVLHLIHRRHTCFSCKHSTAFLFFLLAF